MKARMKKLSALMLATAVVFSMSGCGNKKETEAPTEAATTEAATEAATTEAATTEAATEAATEEETTEAATEAATEEETTEAATEEETTEAATEAATTEAATEAATEEETTEAATEEETTEAATEEETTEAATEEETTEAATEEETTEAATEEETTEAATEEETTEAATEEETTEAATEKETTEAATEEETTEAATEEETTEVEKPGTGKTLKVAMECGYAPYNWTQPDDSNGAVPISGSSDYAYGYDVMMAQHICDELGYELEIVKLDWDSLVPAVQSGTVDCVIAGQSITSARLEMVDFSEPYYYASIITLTKEDSEYADAKSVADLKGATCTSQQNTVWYDVCLPQIEDANILPAQESAPAMLVALDAGKCDIIVTDMPTGMAACVAYPEFKLLDFSGTDGAFEVSDEEINIGISMKKGNTELKEQINSVLEKMTEEDYAEMMDQAIAVQPLSE